MRKLLFVLFTLLTLTLYGQQVNELAPYTVSVDVCPTDTTLLQLTIEDNSKGTDPVTRFVYSCKDSIDVASMIEQELEKFYGTKNRFEARAYFSEMAVASWNTEYTAILGSNFKDDQFNLYLPTMGGYWAYSRNESGYTDLRISNDSIFNTGDVLVALITEIESSNGFTLTTEVAVGPLPQGSEVPFRRNNGYIFYWIDANGNTYTLRKKSS